MKNKIKKYFKLVTKYIKQFTSVAFKSINLIDFIILILCLIACMLCLVWVFNGTIQYIYTCIFILLFAISYLQFVVWKNIAYRLDAENNFLKKKNKNLKIAVKGLKDDLYKKTQYKKSIRKTIIKEKK